MTEKSIASSEFKPTHTPYGDERNIIPVKPELPLSSTDDSPKVDEPKVQPNGHAPEPKVEVDEPVPHSKVRTIAENINDGPRAAENSEIDLAERFLTEEPVWKYIALTNQWYRWNEESWREDDVMQIYTHAKDFLKETVKEKQYHSKAKVAAVVDLCRYDRRAVSVIEQWDADNFALNTPLGVVDLRIGRVRPAHPEDYCTKITSVMPDPECATPLWTAFLEKVTQGDVDMQKYLKRVAGYCLTGDTREQCFFFLFGPGGNGKGVYSRILKAIVGDYATNAENETFMEQKFDRHTTDMASLKGARLITAGEPEEGRGWNESRLKQFTGGDPITARHMRCDNFTYVPQGKLLFSSNHRPTLKSVNEAIRRRFHLIPFPVALTDAERDEELEKKLKAEMPGILQWMIDGCLDWQREGLNPPREVLDASADYMESEDRLGLWLKERCEVAPRYEEGSTKLWNDWKEWSFGRNETLGTQTAFSKTLKDRGFRSRSSHIKIFEGLRLVNYSSGVEG